ncbi:MAG: hypothetical protein M1827_001106 [Pycnora praestabilis]|nr:MAG: hypothetical protein M1827_001106 [Pycnora praestabilis]
MKLASAVARAASAPLRPLKKLHCKDITYFMVFYSPDPVPSHMAQNILDNHLHVLYFATKQRYSERDRDTLWWSVSTLNSVEPKRVVRSWLNRRGKISVTEALRSKGLDQDGRYIEGAPQKSFIGHKGNLRGSFHMQMKQEMVSAKFEDVRKQAGLAVDLLIQACAKEWSKVWL